MSAEEIDRLKLLELVSDKRLSATQAGTLMGLSRRQVYRLLKKYQAEGPVGLVSKKRGMPSNRAYPEEFRQRAISIVRDKYSDFGPILAAEKLFEKHSISISKETLRLWMIEEALWATRTQRIKRVHQPRYRRECFGELVQIDGSLHWWFEDRGPKCTLLVYIDDATSQLMHMEFAPSESALSYFRATKTYIEKHGKPLAFYSDKHGVFRVNKKGATTGDGMTQFGRALHELQIQIICANTPQAKGRVERVNRTLQDRLVKEMRLEGISTMKVANDFLGTYIHKHNSKFAKDPLNPKNLHRNVDDIEELDDYFCWKEDRTVSKNLTLQYDKVVYMLEATNFAKGLWKKRVTIFDYPDGRLDIRYAGRSLRYSTYDKVQQVRQATETASKRLDEVLDFIKLQQEANPMKRSQKAPRRTGQGSRNNNYLAFVGEKVIALPFMQWTIFLSTYRT